MVVVNQVGVELISITTEESVETFKPASYRPAIEWPGGSRFLRGGPVPLAHREGVVAGRKVETRDWRSRILAGPRSVPRLVAAPVTDMVVGGCTDGSAGFASVNNTQIFIDNSGVDTSIKIYPFFLRPSKQ